MELTEITRPSLLNWAKMDCYDLFMKVVMRSKYVAAKKMEEESKKSLKKMVRKYTINNTNSSVESIKKN
jgi:hypothetical protein